ncbi:serine/threonine-protein kinase [Nocardiopsis xinjiangensis]|uniref:serine/threonine-protein kinase n=1 Tax=Nocardiopsis xinjiangensis TaxID=124285 RepID=UPI000525C7C5|nr:serine/threonine-protein kinase [Nocardiopsis xinjiangensis]
MSNGQNRGKPLRAGDPHELNGYRVASRLGRGGMGTVYLAEDESGQRVALKLIHPDLADDEDFRRRFAREVESARRVARFSTAGVIDARLEGEPLYIASEYVPGPNLDEAVRADGSMSGGTLESLAMGVAAALTAIHGSGVVHRDLKPANVLLSPVGPKVIDFGIARALDDADGGVTRSSQLMGTPSYMAPELILGEQPTAAADIFAWGCLVAFAGIGSAPFDAATVPAVLHNISTAPPRLQGLDQGLSELVVAALDKDPLNRPTSQQLLARLTGQEQPEEAEVNRTISTSWAPPSSAPVPGAPPQETAAQAAEAPGPQSGPQQPPSGPQQPLAPSTPPSGQPTTPRTTPPTQAHTAQQGSGPSGPRSPAGAPDRPPSGPQQPHPGQVPPGAQPQGGPPYGGPHPQQHPYARASPAQGQQAFTAAGAPGAPNGPGDPSGPGGPGGPGQSPSGAAGPSGGKRRTRTAIAAAGGAALLVVALIAVVAVIRSPSVPSDTLSLYSTDFSANPDWTRNTFEGDPDDGDGYWAEEQAMLLHVDPSTQLSRGEYLEREDEALPDHVLVSATAHVLEGPDEATFGVRCWGNAGEDEFTKYEAVVRADGQQAQIRRSAEESGDNALATASDVSGFEGFENLDPDSDVRAGIDGYSSSEAVTNTLSLACEYDAENGAMDLSLWVNDSFVVSAVDENPLPDDAEDEEDRRQAAVMARAAPGNESVVDVLFQSFSVHEITDEP